ncbi:TadE/TadG family type IV pilus assembly protein [Geminicoccaceae bacterium 1502E]|nr:TadE/TadG family type IV pilus assembly protein [Geminicoccaceae bacterium 1502E]
MPARSRSHAGGPLDRRGVAAVDFALVAPALLLLLVGFFELALLFTGNVLLQAGASNAARAGILGSSPPGVSREQLIRLTVGEATGSLLDPARLEIDTLVYPSFDSIGRPETWIDLDGNGRHDPLEPFQDANGNGKWDADMGRTGAGGASEVVLYRISYDWRPIVPMVGALVPGGTLTLRTSLAVRNEPFEAAP